MPSSSISSWSRREVGRRRLGVGGEAGDRLELQAVAAEVAERVVGHDDGVRARSRPGRRRTRGRAPRGRRAGRRRCRGSRRRGRGRARRAASATASPRSAISSGSCQKCGSTSPWSCSSPAWSACSSADSSAVPELDDLGDVERRAGGVGVDRVVDRGLEAVLVDHQVGLRDLGGLLHGQLEVVRLAARGGEVRRPSAWSPATRSATYCQRVERRPRPGRRRRGRRSRRRTPRSRSARAAATGQRRRGPS